MKTLRVLVLFMLLYFFALGRTEVVNGQEGILQGPLVLGQPLGPYQITFQDIGTGRTWNLSTPIDIHRFATAGGEYNWSPDGCQLLIRNTRNQHWATLSIVDMVISELRETDRFSSAVWHPDCQSITFVSRRIGEDDPLVVYSMDLHDQTVELLFEADRPAGIFRWLSDTELLYGYYVGQSLEQFVWDSEMGQSRAYDQEIPNYERPSDWYRFLYSTSRSPNGELLTRFYDINTFNFMHDIRLSTATEEEIARADAVPQEPGFDIHLLREGITRHIDANGQLLNTLVWSPSSQQIAITTYVPADSRSPAGGVYVYDIEEDSLRRLGHFASVQAVDPGEHGIYVPSWSPDEQWLAFHTLQGWVAYNIADDEATYLNPEFTGWYFHLSWSPVTDYSASPCGG